MLNLKHITKDGGRPPIVEAISKTLDRYVNGFREVGHVCPPRVGKTAIAKGIALELGTAGAPFVLCLCPWKNLADQLAMADKTRDFLRYYGVVSDHPFSSQSITSIPDSSFYQMEGGTPTLMSCTIGLASHAALESDGATSPLIEAIRTAKLETKMSPVIIVDEVQVVGNSQAWGRLVNRMMDAGAFIVSMTGTEVRSDYDAMPGFQRKDAGKEPEHRKQTAFLGREEHDGALVNRLREDSQVSSSHIIAPIGGINVGWDTAFRAGWMLRSNVITIDTEEVINGSEKVKLSEIPKTALSGKLGKILRDEKTIAKGAEVLIKRMEFWRKKTGKKAQALVITGADTQDTVDKGDDYHARECRRVILRELEALGINGVMSNLRIEIATSNPDGDEKANDKIKAFTRGEVDILIVKMMGLVGLDVPACMINLNLSTVRKGPLAKQANSRQLTPWHGVTDSPADLIIPWDQLAQEMVADLSKQGGVTVTTWSLDELGEEYTKPAEEKAQDTHKTTMALVSGYADEIGGGSAGDQEALLYAIKLRYTTGQLTDPEIMLNYEKGGFPVSEEEVSAYSAAMESMPDVIDLTALAEEKIGQFGKRAKRYANEISPYPNNPGAFRDTLILLQSNAKKIARFRGNVSDVCDPHLLQRLMEALDDAYLQMTGRAGQ